MRFGFGLVPRGSSSVAEIAAVAENKGFELFWVADQEFYEDPYLVLEACARRTSSIKLGVGVTNPYTRHPSVTARAIGTLDLLSNGRAVLGLGTGEGNSLLHPIGYPRKRSVSTCVDALKIIRDLLSNEMVNFTSENFSIQNVKLQFQARSSIPLYIAGTGPKILQAAGQIADGVILGGHADPDQIKRALTHIESGITKREGSVGGRPAIASWVRVNVSKDRGAAMERWRRSLVQVIGGRSIKTLEELGITDAAVKKVAEAYLKRDIETAARYVTDEMIEKLTVTGTPETCIERIKNLEKAGIGEFNVLAIGTTEQQRELATKFGEEVIPSYS